MSESIIFLPLYISCSEREEGWCWPSFYELVLRWRGPVTSTVMHTNFQAYSLIGRSTDVSGVIILLLRLGVDAHHPQVAVGN